MEISVDLFDKICRACLCQSADMKSLLTKTEDSRKLVDMLCFIGNININLDDKLPKQVCNDCEIELNKADAFKRRCIESNTYLEKVHEDYLKLMTSSTNVVAKDECIDNKSNIILLQSTTTVNCDFVNSRDVKNGNDGQFSLSTTSDDKISNSTAINGEKNSVNALENIKIEFDIDCSDNSSGSGFEDTGRNAPDMAAKETESNNTSEMEAVILCQCGLVLNDRQAYKFHLTITNCDKIRKPKIKWLKNENEQDIDCPRCNKKFPNTSLWKDHFLSNCDETANPKNTNEHINYQCSVCSRKYKSKKTLASHIRRLHKASKSYKCQRCNREFKHKAFLDNHVVSVHMNDQVTCEYCGKQCTNQEELEKHRDEHMEKKHQCTVCKKAFTMLCTLKEHLRTHTGEKPFLCSFCGKGFSQKNNLQQHVMRHQGHKPFKCESCDKRFVSKGELDAHTRKHSGAHPFICDDCGNGFTTSSSLFKHRRIHTGERPYQCDLCPMRFTASGTLKNHRRTHTGERPYQCSHCEKAFVQRNDLVSHIRCHTGERPFSCDHCGQGFRKATGLKAHLKVHGKRDGEQIGMVSVAVQEPYRPTLL